MSEPTAAKKAKCDPEDKSPAANHANELILAADNKQDQNDNNAEKLNSVLLLEADKALQESNRRHIKPVVDESRLGIELFVGDIKDQYHGLIKSRYADFIVHEIDLEGNTAQLLNLEPPADDNELSSNSMKLEDLFDRKILVNLSNVNAGTLESYKIDVTGMDKDMRTSIHHAIKASYDKLESSTISDSDKSNLVPRNQRNGASNQKNSQTEDSKAPDSTSQQVDDGEDNSEKKAVKSQEDREKTVEDKEKNDEAKSSDEEKKYILVVRRNKISRPRSIWPQDRPDYTHFVLYKENKDTMDAIHNLAISTHTKPAHFTYAGTKDRRAITTQWVSSWRLEPRRLIGSMRRFNKRPFIKVGNFCYKKEPIRLGQLRANKFDIVIRHLVHNSRGVKVIEDAVMFVKDNGFVNYFGLQRFGTRSVSTHEVGLAILQGKWAQAADLILSYRYDDNTQPLANAAQVESAQTPDALTPTSTNQQPSSGDNPSALINSEQIAINQQQQQQQKIQPQRPNINANNKRWASGAEQHNACIDLWKSKLDADLVFKKYPHFRMTNEGLIIRSLSRSEDSSQDYSTAICSLPRNTRSMYVHSYQSLLWNKLATLRLKKYGFKVIPGDLILSPEANISDNSLDILLAVDESETPDESPPLIDHQKHDYKNGEPKLPVEEIDPNILIVSEDNMDKYTIFDVVLPLVGSRTKIPQNEFGKELERLLAADNLTLESFRAREKTFVSYGSYRKIMVKPKNLEWSIEQYSNPYANLVETDLDKLNKEMGIDDQLQEDKRQGSPTKSDFSDEALIVSFELPPSSYATMCLRELMKKPSTDFNNRF